MTERDHPEVSPSYPASVAGYLRPGPVTPREGAAGLTLLAGTGAAVLLAIAVLARRHPAP
jgi:hypothetical protein